MSNPTINIGVAFDLKRPIKDLEKQIGNVEQMGVDLGVSKETQKEIDSIKSGVQDLYKTVERLGKQKISSEVMQQYHNDISKQLTNLETRSSALEQNFKTLIQTMNTADGGKFQDVLDQYNLSMQNVVENTSKATETIKNLTKAASSNVEFNIVTKEQVDQLEETVSLLKSVNKIQANATLKDGDKAKRQLTNYIQEYLRLQKTLAETPTNSINYADLQDEIGQTIYAIKQLETNIKASFDEDSVEYTEIFEKNNEEIGDSCNNLIKTINKSIGKTIRNIQDRIQELTPLVGKELDEIADDIEKKGNGKGYVVPVGLSTTDKQLASKVAHLVERVRPLIANERLEVGVSIVTDWGNRKQKELLKELQAKLDSLTPDADVSEVKQLYQDITKYFNDEITLKIRSDIDKVAPKIKDEIDSIRQSLRDEPLTLDLDNKLNNNQLSDEQKEASKYAHLTAEELQQCLSTEERYLKKCKEGSDKYKERKANIEEINRLLAEQSKKEEQVNKPLKIYDQSVLTGLDELADRLEAISKSSKPISEDLFSIQESLEKLKVGGIVQITDDVEKLDEDFEKIKQDLLQINGNLRKENLTKIQNAFKAYTDYIDRGGRRNYTELSDKENIQNYFKNHLKNVLKTSENDYRTSGRNVGLQFAEGITESIGEIVGAVTEMVNVALETIQIVQDSASPSKKTYELGWDFAAGYAGGIHDGIKDVKKSAEEITKSGLKESTDTQNETIQDFADSLANYLKTTSKVKSTFWQDLADGIDKADSKLQDFIKDLGITNLKEQLISDGAVNVGGIVGSDKVLIARQNTDEHTNATKTRALAELLNKAADAGVNVARILDVIESKNKEVFLEIQETAKGIPLQDADFNINTEVLKADDQQILKLVSDLKKLNELGIDPDIENISNVLYDVKKGFSLIDLGLNDGGQFAFKDFNHLMSAFIYQLRGQVEDIDDIAQKDAWNKLVDKVENTSKDLIDTAEEATKKTQKSHSPSKVAEKLGEYWGEGYAEGILKAKGKVKDAIRALVETGKLTTADLLEDAVHAEDSQKVYNAVSHNRKLNKPSLKNVDIIKELDTYREQAKSAGFTKLPQDQQVKQSILEVQKKNLNDLRKGTIDAEKALIKLRDAYKDVKITSQSETKEVLENQQQEIKTTEQQIDSEKKLQEVEEQGRKKRSIASSKENDQSQKGISASVQEQNDLQKELKETEQQAQKASTAIKEIRVWLKDENTDAIINELVPSKYADLVNGKVFQNRNDMQNTMMALSRGSKFALEHGLAAPKDLTDALKKIEALEDYNQLLKKKNQLEKESNQNSISSGDITPSVHERELLSATLENVLKLFQEIDSEIVETTNSFDKLVERGFAWNSITGEHTDFSAVGNHNEFTRTFDYKKENFKVDSALHTHPEEYSRISSSSIYSRNGDLRSWYQQWQDGIRTQFIRGLKETLVFDAEQFYSDLESKAPSKDKTAYIDDINQAIDSNQDYFLRQTFTAKDLSKFEIAKEAYLQFIDRLLNDSDELVRIFGDEESGQYLVGRIKENLSNLKAPINHVGDYLRSSFDKEGLQNIYGDKASVAKMMLSFATSIWRDIGKYGTGNGTDSYIEQFRKIFGERFAKVEEEAFNYVLQNMVKNGKSYSDYVKRYDNTTFDSQIWNQHIPNKTPDSSITEEIVPKLQATEDEIQKFLAAIEQIKGSNVYNGIEDAEGKIAEFAESIHDGMYNAEEAFKAFTDSSSFNPDARVDDLEKEQKQAQETAQAEEDLANARKQANSGKNTLSDDELRMYADWAEESARAESAFEESVVPLDKISEGLKEASKYSDNLLDSLEKLPTTVQKGLTPIDGNHWRDLDRIAQIGITEEFRRDKKKYTGEQKYTEKQIADATNILKLAGDFQQTGDTSYLKELYKSIDSSEISGKMKKALRKSIKQIVDDIQKGAEQAIEEVPKEQTPKRLTKIVTKSKGEYKDYVKEKGLIADNEAFEHNFDLHLKGLERKGLAEQVINKNGRKGKWKIQVEVEVDDKELEPTEKQIEELNRQEREFVDSLTSRMTDADIRKDLERADAYEKIAEAQKKRVEVNDELNKAEKEFVDSLTPTMSEAEINADLEKAEAIEKVNKSKKEQVNVNRELLQAEESLLKQEKEFVDSLTPTMSDQEIKNDLKKADAYEALAEAQRKQIQAKKELKTSSQKTEENTDAVKRQNDAIKENTNLAKTAGDILSSSVEKSTAEVDELNKGFEKLKLLIANKGDFNLRQKENKEALTQYVDQYFKYKERGGTRDLSELTDNSKVLSKLRKEYEKQLSLRKELSETASQESSEEIKTKDKEISEVDKLISKLKELEELQKAAWSEKDQKYTGKSYSNEIKELKDQIRSKGYTFDIPTQTWVKDVIDLRDEYNKLLGLIKSNDFKGISEKFSIDVKDINDAEKLRQNYELLIKTLLKANMNPSTMKKSWFEGWISEQDLLDGNLTGAFKTLGISDEIINSVSSSLKKATDQTDNFNEAVKRTSKTSNEATTQYERQRTAVEKVTQAEKPVSKPKVDSKNTTDNGTTKSAKGADKEAKKLTDVQKAAQNAAIAKETFADANREVLNSIIDSLNGLNNEGKAFENLNKLINNLGGKNGSAKLQATVDGLHAIIEALTYPIENNSFISTLEKIAQSGSNLGDIATILRASTKNLKNAVDTISKPDTSNIDKLIDNNIDSVIDNAKKKLQELGGNDSQIMNISNIHKTRDGLLEIVAVLKTIDGEWREYTLHSKDGIEMQNVAMNENTARLAKQMKIYSQVEDYFNRKQEQNPNLTNTTFFDPQEDPELWKLILDYASEYAKELGEIRSITRQVRQDKATGELYESYSLNGSKTHLTIGREGETVATRQDILNADELEKRIKHLKSTLSDYYKYLEKEANGTIRDEELFKLNKLREEYQQIEQEVVEYSDLLQQNTTLSENYTSTLLSGIETYNNVLSKYAEKSKTILEEAKNNPLGKNKIFTNSFNSQLDDALGTLKSFETEVLKHNNLGLPWDEESLKQIQKWEDKINKAIQGVKSKFEVLAKDSQVDKLLGKISRDINDNTRMPRQLRQEYVKLRKDIDLARKSADGINEVKYNQLVDQFNHLHEQLLRIGKTGKSMFQQIADAATSRTAQAFARYFSFYDIVRYGREAFGIVRQLDDALVDLKKTTAMNNTELNDFYSNSSNIAKQMGVTTEEIISQSAAWSRLGYNTKEQSEKLAQLSSKFASISPGMSSEQAQSGMVSIMKAWNMNTDQVEREVLDNINRLGNRFAETNLDIVEGMQRSAAAMAAVGENWRNAFALFTGGQEIVQNANKMGTALRSFSLRIRGYSEESEDDNLQLDEELKNIKGDLIDLTKTAQHTHGVSIFKDGSTTEMKSVLDYLGEVSEIWDEMNQKQQNDFLQKAFAKTQAQAGAAILQNFDAVKDALKEMETAGGAAEDEMEIIRDSLSFKTNELKQTWIGLLKDLIDRGILGQWIDNLTIISEKLVEIIKMQPGPILSLLLGGGVILHNGGLTKTIEDITRVFQGFENVLSRANDISFFTDIAKTTKDKKQIIKTVEETAKEARQKWIDTLAEVAQDGSILKDHEPSKKYTRQTEETLASLDKIKGVFGKITDDSEDVTKNINKIGNAFEDIGKSGDENSKTILQRLSELQNSGEVIFGSLKDSDEQAKHYTKDTQEVLESLKKLDGNFGPLSDGLDDVNDAAKTTLQDLTKATEAVDDLGEYSLKTQGILTGMSSALEKGFASLKGLIASISPEVAALAIVLGVIGAGKLFEHFTVSAKEAESDLKDVQDRISSLRTEIDSLKATMDSMDDSQSRKPYEQKLKALEDELKLQKLIEEVEQRRVNQEKFGTKFSDQFDPSNYAARLQKKEHNRMFYDSGDRVSSRASTTAAKFQKAKQELDKWTKESQKSENKFDSHVNEMVDKYSKIVQKLNEEQSKVQTEVLNKQAEYRAAILDINNALISGTLDPSQEEQAKKSLKEYQSLLSQMILAYNKLVKVSGQYDPFDDVLASLASKWETGSISADNILKMLKDRTKDFSDEEKKAFIDSANSAETYAEALDSINHKQQEISNSGESIEDLWNLESELKKYDIKEEDFTTYLKTFKELNPELALNQKELEKTAFANYRLSLAQTDLKSNLDGYIDNITKSSRSSIEFTTSIQKLADDLSLIAGEEISLTTAEAFAADSNRLELLRKAVNGNKVSLNELKKAIKDTDAELKSAFRTTDAITKLNELKNGLDQVGTAMSKIDASGHVDFSDLGSMASYFAALNDSEYNVEAVNKAFKILSEGTGTAKDQADAFNTLADQYVRSSQALEGLSEDKKLLYMISLRQMGVLNAEQVVNEALQNSIDKTVDAELAQQAAEKELVKIKAALDNADEDLVAESAGVVNSFLDEETASEGTRAAVWELINAETIFANDTDMGISEKVKSLESLANAFLGTAAAAKHSVELQNLQKEANSIENQINKINQGYYSSMDLEDLEKQKASVERRLRELSDKYRDEITNQQKVKFSTKVQYSGGDPVKDRLGTEPTSTLDAVNQNQKKSQEEEEERAKKLQEEQEKAAKEAEDTYDEFFDYFERRVKVCSDAISLLNAYLEDVVGSAAKNQLLDAQERIYNMQKDEYDSAQRMYETMAEKALAKIPDNLKNDVKNGAIAIDEFIGKGNEEVVKAIQEYQKWADKITDCKQQLAQLREQIRQLELKRFKNIAQDWQDLFDLRQNNAIDLIDKQIDLIKESGGMVGEAFYETQKDQSEKILDLLKREKDALLAEFNRGIENGTIN